MNVIKERREIRGEGEASFKINLMKKRRGGLR